MIRIPTNRAPTHPGEMLKSEFLTPGGLTQRELAEQIRVPYQRVNELVNGRRGVAPSTALGRISQLFEGTDKGARIVSPRWGWLRGGVGNPARWAGL
jgi:addiction module HigA family antidote